MTDVEKPVARGGRPPGFDRGQAVGAAMELFWERGIERVSSAELAEAMGIQRSSFYNSFGGKAQVFREALARYAGVAPDRQLDAIAEGEPVLPALAQFLEALCRARAADPRGCLVCNGIAELAGAAGEPAQLLEAAIAARLESMRGLFAQAIRQGELPADGDPVALADSFVLFLIGLNVLSKVVRDERRLAELCRRYLAAGALT